MGISINGGAGFQNPYPDSIAITKNWNGITSLAVSNNDSGGGAYTQYNVGVETGGNDTGGFYYTGTNFTGAGRIAPHSLGIFGASSCTGMHFTAVGDVPIVFYTGDIEAMRIDDAQDITMQGDLLVSGKITGTGGVDPPYLLLDALTATEVIQRIANEVPQNKQTGLALWWNGEKLFGIVPTTGKIYEISMTLTATITMPEPQPKQKRENPVPLNERKVI